MIAMACRQTTVSCEEISGAVTGPGGIETDMRHEALAIVDYHAGDTLAAIVTLLHERDDLEERLAIARIAMGVGYTRGWKP